MYRVNLLILLFLHLTWAANDQCDSDDVGCLDNSAATVTRGWEGNLRVVVDNVIDQDTCDALVEVSSQYADKGGNYQPEQQGKHGAPYNNAEYYTGIDTYWLRKKSPEGAAFVNEVASKAKSVVKQFMDRNNIDFDLIDLVCREAVEGEVHGDQFSMGLHADYCSIEEDGSCVPFDINEGDMTVRTTVAFLYLTEVEDGGQLLLAKRPSTVIETAIKPQCGRLVAVDSGEYKAIKAVKKGKRCEIAMWFKKGESDGSSNAKKPEPLLPPPGLSLGWNDNLRLIQENLIGPDECGRLKELALRYGVIGSGYHKSTQKKYGSIHTNSEAFTGVSLSALQRNKEISKEDIQLVQDTANLVKKQIEEHLNRRNLEFDLVDLPCRIAVEGEVPEDDFSLSIHADNCEVLPDDTCTPFKKAPALMVRNTTAMLYLNGDFEGGEFCFAQRPKRDVTHMVKPECGKLVALDSGEYHGVKAVSKGTRCALALWFRERKKKPSESTN